MATPFRDHLISLPLGTKFKMLNGKWFSVRQGDIIEMTKINPSPRDCDAFVNFTILKQDGIRERVDDTTLSARGIQDYQVESMFRTMICSKHF